MRFTHLVLAFAMLVSSCSTTKKSTSNSQTVNSSTVSNPEADGSSFEKAIIINKKNETDGVAEEYKWLREHYPGYTFRSQSLNYKDKRSYDILKIKTQSGEEKSIYFDITNFFGKF